MGTILHIPHSSEQFPPGSLDSYGVGEEKVREEARILGDLLTDRLFPAERYPSVLFPWSRLWVDVERFREDGKSPGDGFEQVADSVRYAISQIQPGMASVSLDGRMEDLLRQSPGGPNQINPAMRRLIGLQ